MHCSQNRGNLRESTPRFRRQYIFVSPGEDRTTVDQSAESCGVGFNVFTMDAVANADNQKASSKSTRYEARNFKSAGENIFVVGKKIPLSFLRLKELATPSTP
ncbi:MAG: hypothetical protein LBO73_04000 [Holosporaceae bacterium]|nr:hypothetical protein [Holosporaceae bacterium]